MDDLYIGVLHQILNVRQILMGRAAAVVAYAPQRYGLVIVLQTFYIRRDLLCRLPQRGIVFRAPKCLDLASVVACPVKILTGQLQLGTDILAVGPHKNVVFLPALFYDLHQAAAMTKGVKAHCGLGQVFFAESAAEEIHTYPNLPNITLAVSQQAVRLQIPATGNMPFLLLYKLLDSTKQLRCVLFRIFINATFTVTEYVIVLFHQIGSTLKSGQGGGHPLCPFPLPDGVDMRITN